MKIRIQGSEIKQVLKRKLVQMVFSEYVLEMELAFSHCFASSQMVFGMRSFFVESHFLNIKSIKTYIFKLLNCCIRKYNIWYHLYLLLSKKSTVSYIHNWKKPLFMIEKCLIKYLVNSCNVGNFLLKIMYWLCFMFNMSKLCNKQHIKLG